MDLQKLLPFAVAQDASDIHLQAATPPMLRITGRMRAVAGDPLTVEQVRSFVASIVPPRLREGLDDAMVAGLDFSHSLPDLTRFRCSAYHHLGQPSLVMRLIRNEIRSIESLTLPKVVRDVALAERGLTLVAGTTGSGKSTTLAAMIDLINEESPCKIITIEDPVEYVHKPKKALVSQLEVGTDTPSFEQALRQVLRQDPDVILIGELRDVETLRIALRAADTGHQVFSTLHSANTAQTVERIIAMFPPAEHKLLLSQLAGAVEAIIAQRLVPTLDGKRRPAVEILRGTAVSEKLILENRLNELTEYIENGEAGMQSFDQHLLQLYREEVIAGREALAHASHPQALAMKMRGVTRTGAGRPGA